MKKFWSLIIFLDFALLGSHAWAHYDGATFSLGSATDNYGKMQVSIDGDTQKWAWNPFLSLSGSFHILPSLPSLQIIPEGTWVLPKHSEKDAITTQSVAARTLIGYRIGLFRPVLGAGLYWTRISGKGGTVAMANGTSTSTFYLPSESHTAINATVDVGFEFDIPTTASNAISIRLAGSVLDPFVDESRELRYAISVGHFFDRNMNWRFWK